MNIGALKSAFGGRLGIRLVLYSLLISTVLSTISAGIQLSYSYQRQSADVSRIFDQIEEALASPLEKALWKFNFDQVDVILDSIFANSAVATLVLEIPSGQRWERGSGAEFDLSNVYSLIHVDDEPREIVVGELTAFLSLDGVSNMIWAQFWTLLASNLIKAYLSAGLMLLVFYLVVTRHLKDIADFIGGAETEREGRDLVLSRQQPAEPDDLDNIAAALNRYKHALAEKITDLQSEVTVRKKAEAEAQKAFEVRKTFLANMSHEVRTPLNAIMGLFQLIQMSDVPERQKKQAEVGLNASHHLLGQLVNVLEISKMEADSIEIKIQSEELRPLANQWLETAYATRHRLDKQIDVILNYSPDLPECCRLDAKRVTQIVNNLTNNALKFTENGQVEIRVGVRKAADEEEVDHLEISVRDTGCGIPEHQRDEIFERFVQLDSAQTRENGGSGLGLAICQELAGLMGATLLYDEPVQHSCYKTEFTLRFPLKQ